MTMTTIMIAPFFTAIIQHKIVLTMMTPMTRTPWPTTPLIIPLALMGITTYYDYDNDDDDDDSYASSSSEEDYASYNTNVIIDMFGNKYTIDENDNDILYEDGDNDEPMTIQAAQRQINAIPARCNTDSSIKEFTDRTKQEYTKFFSRNQTVLYPL